jgi:hypothetical protein
MRYEEPTFAPPFRVLVLAACIPAWYEASSEEREAGLDALRGLFERLEERGARLLASMDDDHFATGQPYSLPFSIYVIYDVDDLGIVARAIHEVRSTPTLARFFRMEARVGRQLFLLPQ